MKKSHKQSTHPLDTPATHKQRLQERLQELSAMSEQELAAVAQSIEQARTTLSTPTPPEAK